MTKVLVIENHAVVRSGISNLLKAEDDLTVIGSVANGKEALQFLQNEAIPDVVLTDLHLGDTCGIELTKSIQQLYPQIKVVILTAETNEQYISRAFAAGANAYLLKETDFDELIFAIRKVSNNKHFICTALIEKISQRLANSNEYPSKNGVKIHLSKREMEILQLLSDGFTNLEIADRLFTSRRTVEGHRQSLLNKAGVRNTPELIKFAMLKGLIDIPVDV
jgi:DNA-binding NarL/FixJ family response regulator